MAWGASWNGVSVMATAKSTIRYSLAALAAFLLAGCGGLLNFAASTYLVSSTVEISDGGRLSQQTLVVRCRIVREPDGLGSVARARAEGDRHWYQRPDGSLLVLGSLVPCRWNEAPALGATDEYRSHITSFVSLYEPGAHPRRRRDVELTRSAAAAGMPEIVGLTLRVVPAQEVTRGIEQRIELPEPASTDRPIRTTGWQGVSLERGNWFGLETETVTLRGGQCGVEAGKSQQPVVLQRRGAAPPQCLAVAPCSQVPASAEHCRVQGPARSITYDDRFSRAAIGALNPANDTLMAEGAAMLAAGAPTVDIGGQPIWAPEVCWNGLCVSGDQARRGFYAYDPNTEEVVRVMPTPRPGGRASLILRCAGLRRSEGEGQC